MYVKRFLTYLASGVFVLCHCQKLASKTTADGKQQGEPESYARRLALAENDSYVLEWSYTVEDVVFRVRAKTLGWVGLGFSPSGGMKGADLVIGWVQDGEAYLTDRFARANEQPQKDNHQDYELLSGEEANQHTTLVFRRKLNTSDCQDMVLKSGTTRLLWSYHEDDPSSADGPSYHGPVHRGTRSMLLFAQDYSKKLNMPADVKTHEFLNSNVRPLRQPQTLYWCTILQFPKVDSRHHIIRYEPVLTPGNEDFVHHMFVYACYAPPPDEKLYTFSDVCLKLPKDIQNCLSVVFVWSIGGGAFEFPANVGYSVGGPGDPLFLRMEVHYDNPRLPDDFLDSSGFRFYYTPSLRQHNAGMFIVGVFSMWWMIIPPKQKKFILKGWCLEECTEMYFPPEGIKVFAAFAHTHLTGDKFKFRQFRNGKLVDEILSEEYFDSEFQEIQRLQNEKTIMPGDVLMTECTFKTTDRTNITYGGWGRTDEMCLSVPFYYPKIDNFGDCTSTSQPVEVLKRLGYKNASELPVEMDQDSTIKAFESFNWTDASFVSKFKKAVEKANLYFRCDNETRLEQMDPFAEWKAPQVEYPDDYDGC
ncbi:DBH-like monooxygenase protein 1 [Acanthaster planci]|uniref:DBH-like monooxygenase protein 1 n=1 Tax=Acanthaster planci TaxID=133434 RepID=A0A8B7YQH7_ACAPL|nr:DBH-like monooxygenase protein 1 [Acanthaster planci]